MAASFSVPLLLHIALTTALALRILYRRLEVSTALAWILLLIAMPIAGPALYLLFGDHSLGRRRMKLGQKIRSDYRQIHGPTAQALPAGLPEPFGALARSLTSEVGFPVLAGDSYTILTDAGEILSRMRQDIDQARADCCLEFYIIDPRGRVEAVLQALLDAAARGVACRILADDFGSKAFFRSAWPSRLRAGGVSVVRSLPVSIVKSISRRSDLRNHRKLLICDGSVAFTGSFNLVDPHLFKTGAHVGEWVDLMMRIEGPTADALACVFEADFLFDGPAPYRQHAAPRPVTERSRPRGGTRMQLVPSGPEMAGSAIYEFIVAGIFNARRRVRIVTPYFIPDPAILLALKSAAKRGVQVQLIVPERLDSRMAHYASQSCFEELLVAGVTIQRFADGLLHTKAILIDDDIAVLGTANMDLRSFYLNLELSIVTYDRRINTDLSRITDRYAECGRVLTAAAWAGRPARHRFLENVLRLAGPLL